MIRGITPIDGAFELMGLHQAQVLMRFIFLETMAGKVIFAWGFILSLHAGLEKGNFRPVFVFLIMFFSLWLLLVVPRAKAVDPVSAMERSGYQEVTTVSVLRKNGYGEIMVSPVLDMISRMMDSLVASVSAAVERGRGVRGYLASPFLFTKVSILTSKIMARGITDPHLEERTVRFYQDHFWLAVKKLGDSKSGLWPGDTAVTAVYQEEGRMAWQALREALYQACDQDKIFSRMFERFYDGKVDKETVVRSFLAHEITSKPERYTLMTYASELERRHLGSSDQLKIPWALVFSEKVMAVLPFMQGGALFFLWSMLPGFLAVTFLLRKMMPLILFMSVLFSIKAWTLVWVILDKVSTVWFKAAAPVIWESPVLNMYVAVATLALPLFITAGMVVILRAKPDGK